MSVVQQVQVLAQEGGGSPVDGIRSVFLGLVVILGVIALANIKRLSVVLAILVVIVVGSTIVFAPAGTFEALGAAGGRFLRWVAEQF